MVRDGLLHVAGAPRRALGPRPIDFAQGMSSHRRSLYFTHHGEARTDVPRGCSTPPTPATLINASTSVVPSKRSPWSITSGLLELSQTCPTASGPS